MKSNNGVTLVELVITMAVVSILTMIAIPSFNTLVRGNRLTAQVNDLVGTLHLARSEAIKRTSTVTLCKRNASLQTCNTTSADNWAKGWLLYVGTNTTTPDTTNILSEYNAVGGNNTLSGGGNYPNYISFRTTGMPNNNGTFTFCDTSLHESREVVIARSGRVRTQKGTCP